MGSRGKSKDLVLNQLCQSLLWLQLDVAEGKPKLEAGSAFDLVADLETPLIFLVLVWLESLRAELGCSGWQSE